MVQLCVVSLHLYVVVRVPVGVEDDHGVGGGQVDAQTPGSGGEQEAELRSTGSCRQEEEQTVIFIGSDHRILLIISLQLL